MALNAAVIFAAFQGARAAGQHQFLGSQFNKLALGIANGVAQWGIGNQKNLGLMGGATGVAGTGTIVPFLSKIVVPANVAIVLAAFTGAGLKGPLGNSLATVTAVAISQVFSTSAGYTGPSASVANGADVSKITTANAGELVNTLKQTIAATATGDGPALPLMARALGNGIASLLLQGTGTGTVQGAPVVPTIPGAGPTNSMVV